MQYTINQDFTQITEKEGVMQNLSIHAIEVITSKTIPDKNNVGLTLGANEKISFKADDNIYIRCTQPKVTAQLAVVNFNKPASSSGNGAGDSNNNGNNNQTNAYKQLTKLSITAPKTMEIPISSTYTFNLPPVEILKFAPGLQNQVKSICGFDNADAGDFMVGGVSGDLAKYVTFDGTMKLKTEYAVAMGDPVALEDGFICESEEIDFAEYKSVEAVE